MLAAVATIMDEASVALSFDPDVLMRFKRLRFTVTEN